MTIIIIHIIFALTAFFLGLFILMTKKGTISHQMLGKLFLLSMMVVAFSAMFIQEINQGQYSFIHLFVPVTIISLFWGIWSIRHYRKTSEIKFLKAHKIAMISLFFGALVVTGSFTLLPGRFLHQLLFVG